VARLEEQDRRLDETARIRKEKRKSVDRRYYNEVVKPRKKAIKKAREAATRRARVAALANANAAIAAAG
jgi:hypothetical protein